MFFSGSEFKSVDQNTKEQMWMSTKELEYVKTRGDHGPIESSELQHPVIILKV
jgi:hypothetical protein